MININFQKYNPYMTFRQGQEKAIKSMLHLWENGQKVVELNAPTASGKCLGRDTPIIMFDGSIKMVQDILPNDLLMGPDSLPRIVLNITTGFGPMYKIIPSWGMEFVCNDAHVLSLKTVYTEGKKYIDGNIINISILDYLKSNNNFKHHMRLWHKGVHFQNNPIKWSPYIIGIWLGDGAKNDAKITSEDFEIIDEIKKFAYDNYYDITYGITKGSKKDLYALRLTRHHLWKGKQDESFRKFLLNECVISNIKRIPNNYLINSDHIKLELLAGLLDSDGWLANNTFYEISTKYTELADDICFLVRSLGFEARRSIKKVKLGNWSECRSYHVITIHGDVWRIPCRVKRKICTRVSLNRHYMTSMFSVSKIPDDYYFGFTLSGDGLFLLGDFTVTHNTVDLYVFGKILQNEYNKNRIIFTSPQVSLIEYNNLWDLPKLTGSRNYPCLAIAGYTAEDCPFTSKEEGFAVCENCSYRIAKKAFKESDFGATTFHRYLADPSIYSECSVLFVDESSELEGILLDKATIELNLNLKDITKKSKIYDKSDDLQKFLDTFDVKPHLESQYNKLQQTVKDLGKQCTDYRSQIFKNKPTSSEIKRLKSIQQEYNKYHRQETACSNALRYIKADVPYVLTSDIEEVWNPSLRRKELRPVPYFKLLDAHVVFGDLIANLDFVVLASGTPTTSMITSQYKSVVINHPIDVDRRLIYYDPVGSMNYNSREQTAKKMSERIKQLHDTFSRKSIIHCGSYIVANLLYDNLYKLHNNVILQERDYREKALQNWQKKDDAIFLSVRYEEGISLDGPEYPINIIAKVPFPHLGDAWVKARNELDNQKWYNTTTAMLLQQACGRTTRGPEDWSQTWILDQSFGSFFNRNKYLFMSWFIEAVRSQ